MRTLELCSGTQSFSKGVKIKYPDAQIVTVDIRYLFKPTFVADIREWDYRLFPPHYFDIIWCSPPCTEYSCAKTVGVRDLELADALVTKCFEIIDYYQPLSWIMENPATGLLPKRIKELRPTIEKESIADYCSYGTLYRKRTAFWSNKSLVLNTCGKSKCPSMMTNGKHKGLIGSCGDGSQQVIRNVWIRDTIPQGLII